MQRASASAYSLAERMVALLVMMIDEWTPVQGTIGLYVAVAVTVA